MATSVVALLACAARLVLLPVLAVQTEAELGSEVLSTLHLGDVLLWVLGGSSEVVRPQSGLERAFIPELPVHWLVIVLLPTTLLASLPVGRDGFEPMLVASGSRARAWRAAAISGVLVVAGFWLVVLGACVIATILLHGSLAFEAGEWTARASSLVPQVLRPAPFCVLKPTICCVAASVALALAQLALQLALGASVAWVVVAVLQLASVLFYTPLLPGNLMMLGRSSALVVDYPVVLDGAVYHAGLEPAVALAVSLVLAAASLVAGSLCLRRDVLRRD